MVCTHGPARDPAAPDRRIPAHGDVASARPWPMRRRHRCRDDRRPGPGRRRAGPGGRRRLPRADPALPPAGLGRARPDRDLGRRPGHPGRGRRPPGRGRASTVAAIGITNQRETLVAFDRRTGRPLHRAIVWQDRRTAAICAELERGRPPAPGARHAPGSSSIRTSRATKIDLAPAPRRPRARPPTPRASSFGTVDTWVLWNLTGGPDGGVFATDPSNASRTLLLDTRTLAWSAELCDLFGVPAAHAARGAPVGRPLRPRTPAPTSGPAAPCSTACPISGILGDQQAALFGQACFEPGMVKVTYGTGSFVLANAGPTRPPAPDGLTVSVAWDLGAHAGSERPPVAYALEGSTFVSGAAIQWLRDGLGIIDERGRDRAAGRVGARQRRRHLRPRPHRARQPVVGPDGPRHHHRPHPGRRPGPARPGLRRGDGLPGARHDRCHGRRLGLPTRPRCGPTGVPPPWTCSSSCRPSRAACPWPGPASLESTALGAATLAGLAEGMWGSLDELAAPVAASVAVRARAARRAHRRRLRRLAAGRRAGPGLGRANGNLPKRSRNKTRNPLLYYPQRAEPFVREGWATMSVAIVTGASRGLGEALAEGLARAGLVLVIDGRDPPTLDGSRRPHSGPGCGDGAHRACRCRRHHRRRATAAALVERRVELGGLDLLVNNAGTLGTSPLPRWPTTRSTTCASPSRSTSWPRSA